MERSDQGAAGDHKGRQLQPPGHRGRLQEGPGGREQSQIGRAGRCYRVVVLSRLLSGRVAVKCCGSTLLW